MASGSVHTGGLLAAGLLRGACAALTLAAAALAQAQAQEQPPAKAAVCAACHGPNGNSPNSQYPHLAGQTSRYIYLQLRDYQEGRRKHELMTPIVAGMTREEMRELADYFSRQKLGPQTFKPDPAKVRIGKVRSDDTLCTMCHLGGLAGQNEIPRVAGQHFDYVVAQLKAFKARTRTNDAGNMTSVANTLSDEDIVNIAHYLASL